MDLEKSFSQRMGFKPIRSTFQIDSMDDILRNKLWNGLQRYYWDVIGHKLYINHYSGGSEYPLSKDEEIKQFYEILWDRYFKKTLDTLKSDWSENHPFVREYFFSYAWYEVYDFIEFITDYYPEKNRNLSFIKYCNLILEQEMSAYRFVGNKISPIIENEEISAPLKHFAELYQGRIKQR
ncbi:MAG: hypothetical protein NTX88_02645 [Candidatus Atribacteria bacterium]|nr:hypothetical protein [Candidatus Atribacteria bacterium]